MGQAQKGEVMLTIYRRHLKKCAHGTKGRAYRRCHCPIWVDGFLGRQEIRQSLGLRDWQKAQDKICEWEAEGEVEEAQEADPVTLQYAWSEFERDGKARGLREPSLKKYEYLRKALRRRNMISVTQFAR
jgi:hypothetical protein